MFKHRIYNCTWIMFVYFVCLELTIIKALQCYTCQNCEDGEDFNELHICGELPVTTRRTTPLPSTTTTSLPNNSSTTTNTTISPDKDEDVDYSDEDFEEMVGQSVKTTIRPGNIKTSRRTTRRTTKATRKTTKRPTVIEEYSGENENGDGSDGGDGGEESEYDFDDEGEGRYKQILIGRRADDAVCYMVKLKGVVHLDAKINRQRKIHRRSNIFMGSEICRDAINHANEKDNGTIVTHRGCTSMVRSNNIMTCASLSAGLEMYDCQLCNTNGCNKFADFDGDWDALWNGGERWGFKISFLTSLLIMLLLSMY